MSLPSINFPHFTVSKILPGQNFKGQGHSLRQNRKSNQGHTMTMHTYNPKPMSLPSINILYVIVSEIKPGQAFMGQGHYSKVIGQIKVTP